MSGTKAKFYVSGLTLLPGQNAGIKLELSAAPLLVVTGTPRGRTPHPSARWR